MSAAASESILAAFKPVALVYCDYIAATICEALRADQKANPAGFIRNVGRAKSDLHPTGGYLVSTKKTLTVFDRNGREYRVTVEEVV